MQVLFNKCYICDLSAMDDGNVELELGLVRLGEDNSADEQPTLLVLQVLGESVLGEVFHQHGKIQCWR